MNDWMPSLNALRAFESAARHLSYSAAAEELRVTPGAVKHLVSKLETTLGQKLLVRQGQTLSLTSFGQAGLSDVAHGMRKLAEGVQKIRTHGNSSRLIVSVEASLASTWLAPRLTEFLSRHPDTDVLVDASQKIFDLTRSDVDVAVRYGVEPQAGLVSKRLFEDFVIPACSPSLANGPPALSALDQLASLPLIHWDTSHMAWASATPRWFSWQSWCESAGISGIDTSKGKRFSDYGLAVQAAISGQGVILAGWPALVDTLEEGLLVCPFENSVTETDIGFDLVTTQDALDRPEVQAFCDWVLETAATVEPMHR